MAAQRRKQSERDILFIGITGGMGCGQSTVAKQFESKGCLVLDADKIAHKILDKNDDVKRELGKAFGKKIFYRNRKINRRLLGELAFKSPEKTHQLNKIVHPRLVEAVVNKVAHARESRKHKVVCLDAALIYEMQMEKMFDHVIVVASRMKQRMERIKERDGLEDALIKERMAKQIPIEEKSKWGDFTIHNNGTLEQLEAKAIKVYEQLTGKKAKPAERKPRKQTAKKTGSPEKAKAKPARAKQAKSDKPKVEKPNTATAKSNTEQQDKPKRTRRKTPAKNEEKAVDAKPTENLPAVAETAGSSVDKPEKPVSDKPKRPQRRVKASEKPETSESVKNPGEDKSEEAIVTAPEAEKPKPRVRSGRRPRRVGPRPSKPPTEGS